MLSGVVGLITNHQSLALSKAHQKSGSFPPLALPSLGSTMTLSETRSDHRRDDVGGATYVRAGLPRLPGSPFRHAVPNTPMDRNGCVCRLLPHSLSLIHI